MAVVGEKVRLIEVPFQIELKAPIHKKDKKMVISLLELQENVVLKIKEDLCSH
jgi:hypothetical protein